MSKFTNSIITAFSSAILVAGLSINIGSFVSTDVVVNESMNTIQKALVVKKNTNEFAAFSIMSVVTQKQSNFPCALFLSMASSLILLPEILIYIIALTSLSNSIKK